MNHILCKMFRIARSVEQLFRVRCLLLCGNYLWMIFIFVFVFIREDAGKLVEG